MKILITTGIYPPKIGGPAQYAKNLAEEFKSMGHTVMVKTYGIEDKLPTGVRHLFFFFKIISSVLKSDTVFVLDTFSVGSPSVLACRIFGRKSIIRTGGDFLWEQYVERTKKKILLREFYKIEKDNFSQKEKIIFELTKWTLKNASHTIFSTDWQRQIFFDAYDLDLAKISIVENYYGEKESDCEYDKKEFIGSTRKLVWKNLDVLERVFEKIKKTRQDVDLFMDNLPYEKFIEKIKKSYAVILVSLGDISPNMIMDAIRLNRPFICTKEVGIYNRIKDAGIFVDPLNEDEIEKAVLNLISADGYWKVREKVRGFSFTHSWREIAHEFLDIGESLGKPERKFSSLFKNIFHSFIVVRYFLCGITSAAANILLLYILTDKLGIWYLYSSMIAFFVSVMISFTLQKFVVFKDMGTGGMHRQFSKFFIAILLGVAVNTMLVFVFVDVVGVWYILSQVLAGIFVMVQNFLIYEFFIFNKKRNG